MPEMHLKQPECTYSACQSFTKNKERGGCNWIRTQNHLVLTQTLNHLAKLAK